MDIIETLGAISTICTDMQGILTCNIMSVSHILYDKKIHNNLKLGFINKSDNFELLNSEDPHFQ